jgi:hypothetical protein
MLKTVLQHIRDGMNIPEDFVLASSFKPSLDDLRSSEWNSDFERLMRNRLIFGAMRYGDFKSKKKITYNYLRRAKKIIDEYMLTGNDELLVDMANYALLEFTFGKHPKKHFKSVDDGNHCEKD